MATQPGDSGLFFYNRLWVNHLLFQTADRLVYWQMGDISHQYHIGTWVVLQNTSPSKLTALADMSGHDKSLALAFLFVYKLTKFLHKHIWRTTEILCIPYCKPQAYYNILVDTFCCRTEMIAELSPKLKSLKDLYSCWSDDEILYSLISILKVYSKMLFVCLFVV